MLQRATRSERTGGKKRNGQGKRDIWKASASTGLNSTTASTRWRMHPSKQPDSGKWTLSVLLLLALEILQAERHSVNCDPSELERILGFERESWYPQWAFFSEVHVSVP
jgi:hypothetical protein